MTIHRNRRRSEIQVPRHRIRAIHQMEHRSLNSLRIQTPQEGMDTDLVRQKIESEAVD
jgi:hypothetical protein